MTTENRPKLLDQVRMRIRTKGYGRSTEKTYVYWIRDYILIHNKRHPIEMGAHEAAGMWKSRWAWENTSPHKSKTCCPGRRSITVGSVRIPIAPRWRL
jgi:hypothetical protein